MFTSGRIIFAIIFVIVFVIFMVISYKRDTENHETYYKDAAKKVILYGTIVVLLFLGFRYLTAVFF